MRTRKLWNEWIIQNPWIFNNYRNRRRHDPVSGSHWMVIYAEDDLTFVFLVLILHKSIIYFLIKGSQGDVI